MTEAKSPPPEWAPHKAIWTAWPATADYWPCPIAEARKEVGELVRLLASSEKVRLLASGEEAFADATLACGDVAEILPVAYGDIWLRDTGPIFAKDASGQAVANIFRFNGWGEKFVYPGDTEVGGKIAGISGARAIRHDFILEGGSVDLDGEGNCLTTRQCLLNPNRNKGWTAEKAEAALRQALGATNLLWLDQGLIGDHTDGHIDNIARFVAPDTVLCQRPSNNKNGDDPHAATLQAIEKILRGMKSTSGKPLQVVTIPSPGRVERDGEVVAASHTNFIIGNKIVVVPVYNDRGDEAVAAITRLFPDRKVVGLASHAILSGGGSFHCITQQEPL